MKFLEVTVAYDGSITPPGPKMLVCISFAEGVFFRINSNGHWKPCVAIAKADHPFLKHDSYVECSPLEFDEFQIDESLKVHGIIGKIDLKHQEQMLTALQKNIYISKSYRDRLAALFR